MGRLQMATTLAVPVNGIHSKSAFTLMCRYRVRSVLLLSAAVAIAIAVFRPFNPSLTLVSTSSLPLTAEPYSRFPDRYRQWRINVQNQGTASVWLPKNDALFFDNPVLTQLGHPAYVALEIRENACTELAPGESRTFDLVVHVEYTEFRLFIDVRDWRGRSAWYSAGVYPLQE